MEVTFPDYFNFPFNVEISHLTVLKGSTRFFFNISTYCFYHLKTTFSMSWVQISFSSSPFHSSNLPFFNSSLFLCLLPSSLPPPPPFVHISLILSLLPYLSVSFSLHFSCPHPPPVPYMLFQLEIPSGCLNDSLEQTYCIWLRTEG